ncbi:hypothetical protein BDU57DRAFT_510436 [Ampelomyces quisqualis]|uniref:Elongation factor-like 1 n=1 Tax=Ampelomyces quisqualis TaxID=50730 RepID=A0A6A5R1J7_AMPQU|nr:hypothetical protein BDU57DRAFT_510436 [Ampelomyces quisqualis]
MESSAISLFFSLLRRAAPQAQPEPNEYLINLIDSPGHIDFSYEVSTASRLCDGAVVLVDAVEGVCSQTVTVLRQTWIEKLKPLLVINKMDRLITELKMTPSEAHTHLSKLVEQVNAVMGSFYQGERMEDDLRWREKMEERLNALAAEKTDTTTSLSMAETGDGIDTTSTPAAYEEKDDEDIYFAPEKNNVIFASAIDGWAFTVRQFASLYERKLCIKRSVLEKVLWGDFYLDPKTKRVLGSKHLKGRHLKPMFVQLVLENIWAIYEATTGGNNGKGDATMVEKITKSLNLNLPAHVLRSRDPRALLTALFAAWLPLSTALLVSVTEYLPPPSKAQAERMPEIIDSSPGADYVAPQVRDAMTNFNTSKDAPVVAYVSKMISVPDSELPHNKRRGGVLTAEEAREMGRKKRAEIARQQAAANEEPHVTSVTEALSSAAIGTTETSEEEVAPVQENAEHLIGFARIFSGTLTVGDEVYVLGPKFTPSNPHAAPEPHKVKITALYLMMGRGLEPLNSVPAGVVFGVGGLEGHVLKSGTLCSQLPGSLNLAGVQMGTQPIVRVALEPENPYDLDKMIKGLKLLVQSDPCAEYEQLPSGEHVILTAGELHLERCLKDLRERFAKCEVQAGEPIVPYRESIVAAPEMNNPKDPTLPRGTVIGETASKHVSVRLRVRPLPPSVTEFLGKNSGAIKRLYAERRAEEEGRTDANLHPEITSAEDDGMQEAEQREIGHTLSLVELKRQLQCAFAEAKGQKEIWADVIEKITAFGPRRIGPNILVDTTKAGICSKVLRESDSPHVETETPSDRTISAHTFASTILYAFQLATSQGPCCAEPVQGIAVFLEDVSINMPSDEEAPSERGRLTGEVIKAVRSSIHQGFLDWSPRMLLAMYTCEIQASTDVLGRVYAVLTRRRGTILSETLSSTSSASTTGNQTFTINALLPVAESFGFSDEIRKRSSGSASPQLRFAGFNMLDEDPFWVPFTDDQLEDLGELADRENVAKRYVDSVRRRKGLRVKEVKVEAEKQKTLKR